MVDKRDVTDAILEANANIESIRKEVDDEWSKSDRIAQFAHLWRQMPPQVREMVRAQNPKAFDAIEKKYLNGGQND